jgi:HEAT repeat protein
LTLRRATAARRAEGALALAELDAPESVEALTESLADPDLEVRAAAGLALASLRDPDSVAALAGVVAGWNDPALARCRRAALRTLVAFRSKKAAVELARALATARAATVELDERSALLAVAYAEPTGVAVPTVVRTLVSLLAHDERPVAERAAALLMLFPAESHGPLARALRSASEPEVRRRAAQALGACRRDSAVAALVAALGDPVSGVRAAAARSLGDMRDPATAVALKNASGDADEGVREAARAGLQKLGTVATATAVATGLGVPAHPPRGRSIMPPSGV